MHKICIFFLVILIGSTGFAQVDTSAVTNNQNSETVKKSVKINAALQAKYLIPELKGLHIGSLYKDVKKAKLAIDKLLKNKNQPIKDISIESTTEKEYIVDATAKGFVYEFVIEYKSSFKLAEMMLKKYGKPNSTRKTGEWQFELEDGLILMIWQYKNKLCIGDSRMFIY